MKKIFLLFLFFVPAAYVFVNSFYVSDYSIRVEIEAKNLNAREIDSQIAQKIDNIILQINSIRDYVIFSRKNYLSLYVKIKPFKNKQNAYIEIERKLKSALFGYDINFDCEYDFKYEKFLAISTDKSYKDLRETYEIISKGISNLKISSKITPVALPEIVAYINFKLADLLKYNLNVSDIKDIIKNSNIKTTTSQKTTDINSYTINTNSDIEKLEDIENIAIFYKDKNFSTRLKDVFDIKETIKHPSCGLIFKNRQKTYILAISKRKFYPAILFNLKLKNYKKTLEKDYPQFDFEIFNPKKYKKSKIYLENSIGIEGVKNLYNLIVKNIETKNTYFFIATPYPKTKKEEDFFEYEKNRLIILAPNNEDKNIKDFLKNSYCYLASKKYEEIYDSNLEMLFEKIAGYKDFINQTTNKTMQIKYSINNYFLRDYFLEKEDVVNTIFALNDGLEADSYYSGFINIPIIIKNQDESENKFLYSKEYKNFIGLNNILNISFNSDYDTISRKNGKYFAKLIHKSPF